MAVGVSQILYLDLTGPNGMQQFFSPPRPTHHCDLSLDSSMSSTHLFKPYPCRSSLGLPFSFYGQALPNLSSRPSPVWTHLSFCTLTSSLPRLQGTKTSDNLCARDSLMFFLHTPSARSLSSVVLQFKHYFCRYLFLPSLLKYSPSFSFSCSLLILYGKPFCPFTNSLYHPVAQQFILILAGHHLDSLMCLSVYMISVPVFRMCVP